MYMKKTNTEYEYGDLLHYVRSRDEGDTSRPEVDKLGGWGSAIEDTLGVIGVRSR